MGVTNNDAIDLSLMDSVFENYREQRGALIPVLQKAQGVYGYLPAGSEAGNTESICL